MDTNTQDYFNYLKKHQDSNLNYWIQTPYRLHIKSLRLGKTLDIGCGAGRNLMNLSPESMGIDHNKSLIDYCVGRGLQAKTTEQFKKEVRAQGQFDSLLFSHVIEHMTEVQAKEMIESFIPYLKSGGKVVAICPQDKGYVTDKTHVQFFDLDDLGKLLQSCGLSLDRKYSFPFPRLAGNFFTHNETVVIGRKVGSL